MVGTSMTMANAKPFDPQELREIRREFPALERYIYFASNGLGLMPRCAIRAATAVLRRLAHDGIVFEIFRAPEWVERARQRVAQFLGTSEDEIAFCRNTTEGLLWVAESLPWAAGDEVLLVWGSHPATVLPFLARERFGVVARWVKPCQGRVGVGEFERAATVRTRCVVVSWVEFHNGFRLDVAALASWARQRNMWVVCDAVQGWGALPFDARRVGVSVAAAGAQKWLLGGPGIGVCFIARAALAEMRAVHVGAGSLASPHEPGEPLGPYDTELAPAARRFEEGTRNLPGIAALEAAVAWLAEVGIERVAVHVRQLGDGLAQAVARLGWSVASPRGNNEWSGILLLRPPPGEDAETWMHRLHQRHIAINHREGCLHLGLHVYNAEEDIAALVQALKDG